MANKKFTKGQLKLEELLCDLGFTTILEYRLGGYFIDIVVPECWLGFEYDSRYHVGTSRDKRRDRKIWDNYKLPIMRLTEKELRTDEISRTREKITKFAQDSGRTDDES